VSDDWVDKLAIRELLERYMRFNDDGDIEKVIELFEPDARYQVVGRIMRGHAEMRAFWVENGWFEGGLAPWTAPGRLLIQPRSVHMTSNPIIEVNGDRANCESDFLVADRRPDGRARIMLIGRYRDRLRRGADGGWRIKIRTGVSVARPGEAGTDSEWRALLGQTGIDEFEAVE
jgi:3-phenylpropionate/cinnamic acid dioxygenase small subunit